MTNKEKRKEIKNKIDKVILIASTPIILFFLIMMIVNIFLKQEIVVSFESDSIVNVVLNKDYDVLRIEDEGNIVKYTNFNDMEIDDITKIILSSLITNDELTTANNNILITMDNSWKLEEEILEEINEVSFEYKFTINPIIQVLDNSDEITMITNNYNITIGKAIYITKIQEQYSNYTTEYLASISINELVTLSNEDSVLPESNDNVKTEDDFDIYTNLKQIVFNHAQVLENNVYDYKMEIETTYNNKYYEIEFKSNNLEYEYKLDYNSYEIIYSSIDYDN